MGAEFSTPTRILTGLAQPSAQPPLSAQSLCTHELSTNSKAEALEPPPASIQSLTDNDLVAAAAVGDQVAFEVLFERHRLLVARIAGHFFHQPDQVEEIIQESFTEVYVGLTAYQGTHKISFVSWLSRITITTCYDALRRARRRPESALSDLSEEQMHWFYGHLADEKIERDTEAVTISRDLASKLLKHLRPEDRLVLTLMKVDDLSVRDIARLTGWSVAKVKVRAHRARLALRRVLHKFL